jgi:hypothetical protein
MAEEVVDRKVLISKIGTFFIVISLFGIIIFVASDLSRNDPGRKAAATQTYIAVAVQALQTRDVGATLAAPLGLPTPTLVPVANTGSNDDATIYFPAFCLGSIGLLLGLFIKRVSDPPAAPSNRFEGLRKMQQRQREAKAKKEAQKKEKEKKK